MRRFCIAVLALIAAVIQESNAAEVCDESGVLECSSNTCCQPSVCTSTGSEFHCCEPGDEDDNCSICPTCIECTWAEWGSWSYDTCGDGNQPQTVAGIRHRKHDNPGNGAPCPGEAQETGTMDCPAPCTPNPCDNGGTCLNENGNAKCTCTNGFSGDTCSDGGSCSTDEDCKDGKICTEGTCGPAPCPECIPLIVVAVLLVVVAGIIVLYVLRKKKMLCFDTGAETVEKDAEGVSLNTTENK